MFCPAGKPGYQRAAAEKGTGERGEEWEERFFRCVFREALAGLSK